MNWNSKSSILNSDLINSLLDEEESCNFERMENKLKEEIKVNPNLQRKVRNLSDNLTPIGLERLFEEC